MVLSDAPIGTALQVMKREIGLSIVGRVRDIRERFYAITLEEAPAHPAVVAVCRAAKSGDAVR